MILSNMINAKPPIQKKENADLLASDNDAIYKFFAENEPDKLIEILEDEYISYMNLLSAIENSRFMINRRKLTPILLKLSTHAIPAIRIAAIDILSEKITPRIKLEFGKLMEKETNEMIQSILKKFLRK